VTSSPCLVCGSLKFRPVFKPKDGGGRAFERCLDCSLLQMRPMPTEKELFDFYQTYDVVGEHDAYFKDVWGPNALQTPEGRDIAERASWVLGIAPKPDRLLEVGSGHGLFLKVMRDAGVQAEGVELHAGAAKKSAELYGVKVHHGTLESFAGDRYAVIAVWDLIEHVADPNPLLAKVHALLPGGGHLFIETPDEEALLDRAVLLLARIGVTWPADLFYGIHHLVLFRRQSMRRLLDRHGFEVIDIRPAETYVPRIFRGASLRDKAARVGLGALFRVARVVDRQNKMLVAARKR